MSHLRYPEDLFKVQRQLLARYHVTDPASFYGGQDFWRVPTTRRRSSATVRPAAVLPERRDAGPDGAGVLADDDVHAAAVTGRCWPGSWRWTPTPATPTGKKRAGYGAMRLLELPRDTTVKGPGRCRTTSSPPTSARRGSAQTLSQFLTLNRTQQGSQITLGNLLTLPVGGGLLYVEPIYVSAKTGSSYPLSRAVVVAFGNQLAWSDTLDGALDGLFGGSSGAVAGDTGSGGGTTTARRRLPEAARRPSSPRRCKAALADVQKALADGQEALKKGDWAAYGDAQKRLQAAVQDAIAAQPTGSATIPAPSGTATPSPSATPTPAK